MHRNPSLNFRSGYFLTGAIALLLGGAAPAPALVGIWRNDSHPRDTSVLSLTEYRADGSFVARYRRYNNCDVTWSQTESGTWSMAGNINTVTTKKIDGKDVAYVHQFGVEVLSAQQYRARDLASGQLSVETRVPSGALPRCFQGGI